MGRRQADRVSILRRYIAWIDDDLGDGWPNTNGLSSLIAFVPTCVALAYSLLFHPNDKPGPIEAALLIASSGTLLVIWLWRAYLSTMRQVRRIREGKDTPDE